MSQFPKIDKLWERVQAKKPISLNHACFIIWAELFVCSFQWKQFQAWVKKNHLSRSKPWLTWKALFFAWLDIQKEEQTCPNPA